MGVKSLRDQQREIAKLTTSYQRLARSGTLSSREIREAQEALRRKVSEVRGELQRESKTIAGLAKQLAPFIGVGAAALFTKNLAGSAITAADDYTRLNSQLRLVTKNEQELAETNEKLFQIAQDTRSAFGPVVELYARAARSTENLNLSQSALFSITTSVNQAMQISGATSTEANSAVLQFTQALQSGVLRGEEFNSISENGARLLKALAEGMGVPIEAMRSMAEAGELTRDRIISALLSQSDTIDAEFSKLERTVDQSLTQLKNSFTKALAQTNTQPLVDSIDELRKVISDPAVIEGLSTFAGWLVKIAEGAIRAAAGVGNVAAEISKAFRDDLDLPLSEIDELDQKINDLRTKLRKSNRGRGDSEFTQSIKKEISALEALKDAKEVQRDEEVEKLDKELFTLRRRLRTNSRRADTAEGKQTA